MGVGGGGGRDVDGQAEKKEAALGGAGRGAVPCWLCLDESLLLSLVRGLRWHLASLILNLAFCLMGGASGSAQESTVKT